MYKRKCKTDSALFAEDSVGKHAKIELIRKFQRIEGNFDCCASAYVRVCNQFECLWREDCLALAQD
ncbi:MAG TPA: hypothetical protein DFK12_07515 [Gallionellaceae bacterium]|nr:hypothetical protein [Gallionellaceae bacterium]